MTAPAPEEALKDRNADGARTPPRFVERGTAAAFRSRSLESRAGSLLSLTVMCVLGAGLLAWYYSAALERPARAAEQARGLAASRAQAEMPLPPLPPALPIARARPPESAPEKAGVGQEAGAPSSAATMPAAPAWLAPWPGASSAPARVGAYRASGASGGTSPLRRTLDRRLAGPAFTARSGGAATESSAPAPLQAPAADSPVAAEPPRLLGPPLAAGAVGAAADPRGDLTKLLAPALSAAVAAEVLPTRTLLLPKGAFIDCTLETAIDSTLPGMTTCITATDTFGADGTVVLLERGSKLVGETRGEVAQGGSRVFVLWTEARTPTGVVIPLASPGTDELGRSGLPGSVNRHFFQRFGAALLISVIDAGAQAAAASRSGGGTVVLSPTGSQDVMSEVLKETLRIAPTVVKHQGDRIQVLVARDLDFRPVYELRAANRGR